jgi:hypothetical protein
VVGWEELPQDTKQRFVVVPLLVDNLIVATAHEVAERVDQVQHLRRFTLGDHATRVMTDRLLSRDYSRGLQDGASE